MHQILLILQVLVAIGVIGLVLLQQGKGADAGAAFGSGGAGSVFGSRGPATLLTRLTAIFAAVFFVNSVALAYLAREASMEGQSVVERYQQEGEAGVLSPELPPMPEEEPVTAPSDVPALPEATGDDDS